MDNVDKDNNIEILPRVILSKTEKTEYLNSVISRTHKILHLIEEEKIKGYSPRPFITNLMFELKAADGLYDNKFVTIIVKLEGIRKQYKDMEFCDIKKQIFEIKRIINRMLKELPED